MTVNATRIILSILLAINCYSLSFSQVKLPQLVSDGMVLQRNTKLKLWGWASPNEKVHLKFKGKTYKTTADSQGNWKLEIKPQKAGGPYKMTIKASNTIVLQDIMIGDVWLCTGQSNMANYIERVKEKYPEEVATANYPEIRHFFVATATNLNGPAADLPEGEWKAAVGNDLLRFTSVGYFFAKNIYEKYKVPIGLINSSVGGTPIEAWITETGFRNFPEELTTLKQNKDQHYIDSITDLKSAYHPKKTSDFGLLESPKWFENNYKAKGWHTINIPGYWEDQGVKNLDGVVWYRKEIDVPEELAGKMANLYMGRIINADYVYLNGTEIGNITYQYPPRRYVVPEGLLKAGKNTIVIRVSNSGGKGGFVPDKPYNLVIGDTLIDLKGTWEFKVGEVYVPNDHFRGITFSKPFVAQNQPAALYNAMVAPIVNYGIKGVLWYQGESNTGNTKPYYKLLPALIHSYREAFKNEKLPFLYVQLANYMAVDYLPGAESNWAELRNAQFKALKVPYTAMAVITDLGEWNDIHPLNKKGVGDRLALAARNLVYKEAVVYSGPEFQYSTVKGDSLVLNFKTFGSAITTNDGEPIRRLEIAGADMQFVWANSYIKGNTVVAYNTEIAHPEFVRYAWADNPLDANLYNSEGLPASPFRNYEPDSLDTMLWHGKKGAVVLTYDDALEEHLTNALPVLDSLHLKATFYLSTHSKGFTAHMDSWKWAAKHGYELGNHTLYHPCDGSKPNRDWVSASYDLSTYTKQRLLDEVKLTNVMLQALDGKDERTFAYTCGDTEAGGVSFVEELKSLCAGARGVSWDANSITTADIYDIDCFGINGETGEELIALAKQAVASNRLVVFLFHGVGGGHGLNVSNQAHRELLNYLKAHENEIWIPTMYEAVEHIKVFRN